MSPDQTPREQLAALLREHGTPIPDDGYPGDEYDCCADALLKAGVRPPARVIETPENEGDYTPAIAALDALPRGTLIQLRNEACQSISGWWEVIGSDRLLSSEQLVDMADGDPLTVLHTPENGDTE